MADFIGTAGNDNLTGTSDADYFDISQGGVDIVKAGSGDDTIYVGNTLNTSDGHDRIRGGDGFDTLYILGPYHTVHFAGQVRGIEMIVLADHAHGYDLNLVGVAKLDQSVTVDASAVTSAVRLNGNAAGPGNLTLIGGSSDDTIIGGVTASPGTQTGGSGNDTIWSGTDYSFASSPLVSHVIYGGGGDDTIRAGDHDIVLGGEGDDYVSFYGEQPAPVPNVNLGAGDDHVNLGRSPELAILLQGGDGFDTLQSVFLHVGAEFSAASCGFEQLDVSSCYGVSTGDGSYDFSGFQMLGTVLSVVCGSGNDVVIGSDAADHLYGNMGQDTLDGREGNDTIYGGSPNAPHFVDGGDTLIGGLGQDHLTGHRGADLFVYQTIEDSLPGRNTRDTIQDFGKDADKIDLSAIDADTTQNGDQAFHLGGTVFTLVPGELIVNAQPHETILSGDVNGDGIADFEVMFAHELELQDADFVF